MKRPTVAIVFGLMLVGGTPAWALDIQRYDELKAKALVSWTKNADGISMVSTQRFDSSTGEKQPAQQETISPSQLQSMIVQAQKMLDNLKAIQVDASAAK